MENYEIENVSIGKIKVFAIGDGAPRSWNDRTERMRLGQSAARCLF